MLKDVSQVILQYYKTNTINIIEYIILFFYTNILLYLYHSKL